MKLKVKPVKKPEQKYEKKQQVKVRRISFLQPYLNIIKGDIKKLLMIREESVPYDPLNAAWLRGRRGP